MGGMILFCKYCVLGVFEQCHVHESMIPYGALSTRLGDEGET